jgi:mono/diheme cytochrome c family protein
MTRTVLGASLVAVGVVAAIASMSAQSASFPTAADIDNYRNTVEKVFMTDRGGTTPGFAACVMCHSWQTRPMRFSLETPATDAGWTVDQSRKNFEIVTKLVNTKNPEASRLLLKPLAANQGGMSHTGGTFWTSKDHPDYKAFLGWIKSLPADKYVPGPEPTLDFTFFRSCVQQVFANPREGHIKCSQCHSGGLVGFAPPPKDGKQWNDEEAKRAYTSISRLILPGNPDQSRFLLKPLHPDGGGSYAHNGVRRWQTKTDPEWQMLAGWVRGQKTGPTCS